MAERAHLLGDHVAEAQRGDALVGVVGDLGERLPDPLEGGEDRRDRVGPQLAGQLVEALALEPLDLAQRHDAALEVVDHRAVPAALGDGEGDQRHPQDREQGAQEDPARVDVRVDAQGAHQEARDGAVHEAREGEHRERDPRTRRALPARQQGQARRDEDDAGRGEGGRADDEPLQRRAADPRVRPGDEGPQDSGQEQRPGGDRVRPADAPQRRHGSSRGTPIASM